MYWLYRVLPLVKPVIVDIHFSALGLDLKRPHSIWSKGYCQRHAEQTLAGAVGPQWYVQDM